MIYIVQGNDKVFTFTLKNTDATAYNLTSCYLFATVKKLFTDADASAVIFDTLTVAAPATGVGVWTVEAADTAYLLGKYYFDLKLKTSANLVYTIMRDDFYVKPRVTIRTATP